MNLDTLRKKPKKSSSKSLDSEPRPVLYHAGCGGKGESALENSKPLCPQGLLMAYEENNASISRVVPVVSDFDCFLVGTRGVNFESPLGERETTALETCVNDIEHILSNPKDDVGWTKRWIEVKKKHWRSSHKDKSAREVFGYADPRSYTMMTGAVHRLKSNGAVR